MERGAHALPGDRGSTLGNARPRRPDPSRRLAFVAQLVGRRAEPTPSRVEVRGTTIGTAVVLFRSGPMLSEFKAFLLKQNILALALAVVVGTALNGLVKALVDDFIMPIVTYATIGMMK